MEPFHCLRCPNSFQATLVDFLSCSGIDANWSDDCWLSDASEFKSLSCRRENQRTLFAVGPAPESEDEIVLVYVNTHSDKLAHDIRALLESKGAEWDYFLP